MLTKQHAIIAWIIWFSILQGAFMMQWFLGDGIPEGENIDAPMSVGLWVLCFAPLILATAIRWMVIPKIQAAQQLVAMIVGLALSEGPIFLSLFLIGSDYPQNQIAVLIVAVFSIIQFAPSYATPGYKIEIADKDSV